MGRYTDWLVFDAVGFCRSGEIDIDVLMMSTIVSLLVIASNLLPCWAFVIPLCCALKGHNSDCSICSIVSEGRKEMFHITVHSTHFIYSYITSDIGYRTTYIVRAKTRCCHYMGYFFQLAARVLLYAPSHRQDSTYHDLLVHQSWSTGWNMK